MKKYYSLVSGHMTTLALLLLFVLCLTTTEAQAQNTAGGSSITTQASGTYDDGAGNDFSGTSNQVTLTVANVSGLAITPDGTAVANVVAGESNVSFPFMVANTSNYAAKIRFLASGASIQVTNGTVSAAFVDYNGNGSFDSGTDLDIFGNGSAVSTSAIDKDASVMVVVKVTVSNAVASGGTVTVQLGDAGGSSPFDNQPAGASAHEVRTDSTGVSPAPVNDESEARGTLTATVDADAILSVDLTAPAGPVNYSDDISYSMALSNIGARDAAVISLDGNSGIYVIANIPANTSLKNGQTWPAGTLFSTDALTTPALSASYVTSQPSASTVRRVAFKVDALGALGSATPFNLVVTVDGGPFDATSGIQMTVNAYANNHVGDPITASDSATTLMALARSVLIGTNGHPDAILTTTNDDYTNKSVIAGINVPFGSVTTADGVTTFINTVKNTGNATDSIQISAPTVPAGFMVEASLDGASYTDISNGTTVVTVSNLAYNATAQVWIRVTEPAGSAVLSAYPSIIRAKSVADAAAINDTINRLYTGYVRFNKGQSVVNGTGRGGASDAVPGAVITYTVQYSNLSTSGGTNCVALTAHNLVITEDGLAGLNTWGTYTDASGSPSDSGSGSVATVSATKYTDTISLLAAGSNGTFTFSRVIK